MLIGEHVPSHGDALVNGFSVLGDLSKVFASLGYCPQNNPLMPRMTCEQHLHLFADLKVRQPLPL